MKPTVKLSDIAMHIEMASDGTYSFYNELTGEFYWYSDFGDHDDRDLDEEEGWLRLPSQRDADEYGMMSDFADTVNDARKREQLEFALSGKGAFRRFKDSANRLGVAEAWYAYRDKCYLEFARDWCDEEDVPYDRAELPKDDPDSDDALLKRGAIIIETPEHKIATRRYEESDEDALFALLEREGDEWQDYWKGANRAKYMKALSGSVAYVLLEDGELCGYARCRDDDGYGLYVYDLLVDKRHRGNEYGRFLLEHVRFDYREAPVYVMSDVNPYYEKLGYEAEGTIFIVKPQKNY